MPEEKKEELAGTDLMYAMFAEAQTYDDVIELDRGDPDFDTPAHVIEAARDAMLCHANEPTLPTFLMISSIPARHLCPAARRAPSR